MGELLLVCLPLADVVQQPGPPGQLHIQPHLGGQVPGQQRHLSGVRQLVLAVRGTEFQPSKHLDDLGVHIVDPEPVQHLLGRFAHLDFDFLLALGDRLLDPARMDAAILDQLR